MPKKERRVVVTGLGPLSPIGFGKDALWDSILAQKTGLERIDFKTDGAIWDRFRLHKISNFDINKFNIEKTALEEIKHWKEDREDKDLLYLLAAIKIALDDSFIQYDKENNNIGLILTIEQPGFELFCEGLVKEALSYLKKHLGNTGKFSKMEMFRHLYDSFVQNGYDLQTFMYLFLVAKTFSFHGYSLFTSNACASGLFALESAVRQIKYGNSDVVLVAGGDFPCTMFKHLWFKEQGLYAEDGEIKPFSKKADGIVFGDGASAIVLEELRHALKRKANIYAEYLGAGFSLEGWKVVFPNTRGDSYKKAIKEALGAGNISTEEIDLINPHGVGIRITDQYEAETMTDVFDRAKRPLVSAFKPYVGHNLGGSALIETIILLLALQKNLIPATLNCEDFDEEYGINLVRKHTKANLKTTMKLSCGFSGYNGAAVFRKLVF